MRKLIGLCSVCVWVGCAVPANAGEVVQFRDGRFATIRAHEIEGPWVRLDYGEGYVILPLSRIATITRRHAETVLYRAPAEVFGRLADRVRVAEASPATDQPIARLGWRPAIRWGSLPPLEPR